MIVQRGFRQPPSYGEQRLRDAPVGILLRRHDERLRRDAGLCRAGAGGRSLGDRRLHPCAAAQSERHGRRRAGRPPFGSRIRYPPRRTSEPWTRRTRHRSPTSIESRSTRADCRRHRSRRVCASDCSSIGDHFFRSWLIAYLLFLGIALGSLALMMIQHLSGGVWGVFRRIFEASSRTLPLLARAVRSGAARYRHALSVDAPGSRRGRRGAASQGGVSEHDVLHRPRGDLLCRLVGNRGAAEQVVASAGLRATSPSTRASSA